MIIMDKSPEIIIQQIGKFMESKGLDKHEQFTLAVVLAQVCCANAFGKENEELFSSEINQVLNRIANDC